MKPDWTSDDGRIQLYCADCLDVLPHLSGVDAVITDPPYGVLDEDWDDLPGYELTRFTARWLVPAIQLSESVLTFAPSSRNEIETLCRSLFPNFRRLIWDKGSSATGADGIWFQYEEMYYCHAREREQIAKPKNMEVANLLKRARESAGLSKGGVDMIVRGKKTGLCYRWEEAACLPTQEQVAALRGSMDLGAAFEAAYTKAVAEKEAVVDACREWASENGACLPDVISCPVPRNLVHRCQKPEALLSKLVAALSESTATVLDPFMGSASTGLACIRTGRKFIGIEKDPKHFQTAKDRIERELQQQLLAI